MIDIYFLPPFHLRFSLPAVRWGGWANGPALVSVSALRATMQAMAKVCARLLPLPLICMRVFPRISGVLLLSDDAACALPVRDVHLVRALPLGQPASNEIPSASLPRPQL